MKRINIVTLGCSKNVVDSEHLLAAARNAGYRVMFDSNSLAAKIVVINTCGFIADAKQESIDTILQFAKAKSEGRIEQLFVIGCLSERYADDLRREIPEVDQYFGARDMSGVMEALGIDHAKTLSTERVLTTPSHYAYLKIAEGCNRRCGYCAIPLIRGRHVSVPMEELVEEATRLAQSGVRELMVIAQDITYYGMDLYHKRTLAELLDRLCQVEGIEWIRLHYAYPADFPDDVIDVMCRQPKICKYLDIPLQHISDSQLRSMKRSIDKAGTVRLLSKLRSAIPDLAIRTTMLVGYPGETAEDFAQLMEFVRDAHFERLGVFTYSAEEGTYSGDNLTDDVPEQEKSRRADAVMELQSGISLEYNLSRVGHVERVIVDSGGNGEWTARSQYDSPEVDTEITIHSDKNLTVGSFYDVRITGADSYDLDAELISEL